MPTEPLNSTRLIADAARAAGIATPLLNLASDLYGESVGLGNAREDMISVLQSIEARTAALSGSNARLASRGNDIRGRQL